MNRHKANELSRRKFLLRAGATVGEAAVLSSGIPLRAFAASAPPAVDIGMVGPFTGSGGVFWDFYKDAANMACTQANEAAKQVLGGPIIKQLYASDSNTVAQTGISAAKKLIDVRGV